MRRRRRRRRSRRRRGGKREEGEGERKGEEEEENEGDKEECLFKTKYGDEYEHKKREKNQTRSSTYSVEKVERIK